MNITTDCIILTFLLDGHYGMQIEKVERGGGGEFMRQFQIKISSSVTEPFLISKPNRPTIASSDSKKCRKVSCPQKSYP